METSGLWANRHADGNGYQRAANTQCDEWQHSASAAHIHAWAANPAVASHAHSICSPKPDANFHSDAITDLDANGYTYHNFNAHLDTDLYVNCHSGAHCHAHSNCTFTDADCGFSDANCSGGYVDALGNYRGSDSHSHFQFNRNVDASRHADTDCNALKECLWI